MHAIVSRSKEDCMNKPERIPQASTEEFLVGGVRMPRPFRIRRLGHFGVNVADPERSKDFYCRLLGFRVSDPIDFGERVPQEQRDKVGPTVGYFSRHGTDHHSFVFFPRRTIEAIRPSARTQAGTVNQITWQCGSLQEVSDAFDWFTRRGKPIHRAGRDLPGSNWHFYPPDPDGHTNELYYGIEQIGWDGYSKPRDMYGVRYSEPPQLPQQSEYAAVRRATSDGVLVEKGTRAQDLGGEEKYDVGGILLAQPFEIAKIGLPIQYLPPELFPGIDYTALAIDPDGFAFQLYYYMEQVGWDGKPRPAAMRTKIDNAKWPEQVQGKSDTFLGEPFLGPLG